MTPYTDEQKADLAKRIEARAKYFRKRCEQIAETDGMDNGWAMRFDSAANVFTGLVRDIRDGSFFEVQHD